MNAVRQIHKVQNGSIVVQLPQEFEADEVEVIVLPVTANGTAANGSFRKSAVGLSSSEDADRNGDADYWRSVARILAMDTSEFSEAKKKAFQRTSEILLRGPRQGRLSALGAFAGLVTMSDDFDEPMEDFEDLFYGSETDEYGVSLSANHESSA